VPELPEVQAHAERLTAALAGTELTAFEPLSFTALKTFDPRPDAAVGRALGQVGRRGKYLLLEFPGGDPLTFVVHLMQGGRLRPDPKMARKPRGGVARWRFGNGEALLLTEPGTEHRAGVWVVRDDPVAQAPLQGLGPEADTVDDWQMAELFTSHPMRLHTFLRDQRILAGIGRRLANEICHRAKLSPFAPTKGLGDTGAAAVVAALRAVIAEDLAAERERDDMSNTADRPSAVHGRTGEPCPVCGDKIREVAYRDYTVHYCATCQTGGKVLADNTTSKFLK
jgi:formamidopyrimidine-DNA glycosylase